MRSNSEIIDIIVLEKDRQNLSLSELARRVGLAKSAMSRYLNKTRQFPLNRAQDFANVLGISVEYLLGVENSSPSTSTVEKITLIADQLTPPRQAKALTYLEKQLLEQNEEETKINEVSEVIQLYSYNYYDHPASAGTGQYLNDVRVEQIELPIDVDADFVIPIKGDSMEPDYHDGDLVFIQTSVDLNDGVIGVFNYNGEAYIKQLVIDTEQAYLHSLNPKYKDMPITPETDFRIIGEVVGRYKEE
jgi:XRE family transcriptional regulator